MAILRSVSESGSNAAALVPDVPSVGEGTGLAHAVRLRPLEITQALEGDLRLAAQFVCLSRLFRATAHHLRDPLNAIGLHLELLKDAALPESCMDEDTRRALVVVDKEFRIFMSAFQAFLRQCQPSPDVRSSFDFRELLDEWVALLAPLAKEQRVKLQVQRPEAAVRFTGLRFRLTQALLHVAIRGLDAMPEGGELDLRLDSSGDSIQVLIADTGEGIASEHVLEIWDMHFTTKQGTTGLGLHVARSILQEHGGTAGIDRTDAHGTTVRILLPKTIEKS